ncbi:MAG: PEP-CTERM sorting domain-containing protein [Sedimentisphaerales bacterium]
MKKLILTSLCVLFVVGTALADWNPGDPNKYVQMPDLSTNGVDVHCTSHGTSIAKLADDFLCTTTGYVTDIHIWGSWSGDYLPHQEGSASAANASFRLSIYSNIPADGQGYSSPGETLWQHDFSPGDFTVRQYATALEDWYYPLAGQYAPGEYYQDFESDLWQYNFVATPGTEPEELFHQQGTPQSPVVYWLGVQAFTPDSDAQFGWKTSTDHWGDDAVFWDPISGSWQELICPATDYIGRPLSNGGQSMDMAFVITPEPATICLLGLGALSLLHRKRSA